MDHYSPKERDLHSIITQVFQDVKYGITHTPNRWNKPVEQINGCTLRILTENELQLTYHHYEVTTLEELAHMKSEGPKFVESLVKELKKEFLEKTGKELKFKKVNEDSSVEKHGRIYADVSYAFGGRNSSVARYLIRDCCTYEFSV
jgi:hypothetical protein